MTEEPAGQLPKHSPSPALVQQLDGLVVILGLLAPDLGQKLLQICHSGRITDDSEVVPDLFCRTSSSYNQLVREPRFPDLARLLP